MSKKLFFSILSISVLVLPAIAFGEGELQTLMTALTDTFVYIGTTVVVIGWIIAGILYLKAQGAPDKLETAKKALIACVVGTALVVLAKTSGEVVELIGSMLGTN